MKLFSVFVENPDGQIFCILDSVGIEEAVKKVDSHLKKYPDKTGVRIEYEYDDDC